MIIEEIDLNSIVADEELELCILFEEFFYANISSENGVRKKRKYFMTEGDEVMETYEEC